METHDTNEFEAIVIDEPGATADNRADMMRSIMAERPDLSPEVADAARQWLDSVSASMAEGNYTAEAFDMAVKAINYDRDVAAAEVRGRNARISAEVMAAPSGDGVPRLGASAPAPSSAPSIFDIARG